MKVLLTGATGFIGSHVVMHLLARGHEVVALVRDEESARKLPWFDRVDFVAHDIRDGCPDLRGQGIAVPDVLMHLAWPGLPNYKDLFHFEENLPEGYRFLKAMIEQGVGQVLVTGTCFEYGMQSGCLPESLPTQPSNPYGLAKDCLRKFLQELQVQRPFVLQWARLFYMYGPGQNERSLLAQLSGAIARGDRSFNMSGGAQVRDYLRVEEVARRLVLLAECSSADGLFNCCSGVPRTVRALVEDFVREQGARIDLNFGFYPYPDYEPMEFWGDPERLNTVLGGRC
ncbi:MAG: NAD(P)-dependent oxidoreductase [Pseudomonadota bacterium]